MSIAPVVPDVFFCVCVVFFINFDLHCKALLRLELIVSGKDYQNRVQPSQDPPATKCPGKAAQKHHPYSGLRAVQ